MSANSVHAEGLFITCEKSPCRKYTLTFLVSDGLLPFAKFSYVGSSSVRSSMFLDGRMENIIPVPAFRPL